MKTIMIDYSKLGKAVRSNRTELLSVIEQLLMKSDDDLKKTLEKEGYLNAEETVLLINALEEKLSDAFAEQKKRLLKALRGAKDKAELVSIVRTFLESDANPIQAETARTTEQAYSKYVPVLADEYMNHITSDMTISHIRARTADWIQSWSKQLAELTKLSTSERIQGLLEQLNETGKNNIFSVARDILNEDLRKDYSRARQYALTEALRIHSVAHEEAIQQNPTVQEKEWKHSGGHKNTPRQNHVDMDGQKVSKDQPFSLVGRNGSFYAPMFPRDPSLPPSESVNCHCIHRAVVNLELAKLPLEERERMQEDILNKDKIQEQNERIAKLELEAKTLGFEADYSNFNPDLARMCNDCVSIAQDMFGKLERLHFIREYHEERDFYATYAPQSGSLYLKNTSDHDILNKMKEDAESEFSLGGWSTGDCRHVVMHEIGHAIGHQYLTDSKRSEMEEIRKEALFRITGSADTDIRLEVAKNNPMLKAWGKQSKAELSLYAFESTAELVAESVAQALLDEPSAIAQQVIWILME